MDQQEQFEPTMLYKDGGPHQRRGGTYDSDVVQSQQQHDEMLASGVWYSHPDFIGAKADATLSSGASAVKDDAPPTREELKQKATELGIEFAPNTGDKKLRELIDAKLAEQPKD